MDKNILITGGCGFIGDHLSKKLLSLGYRVFILDYSVDQRHCCSKTEIIQGSYYDIDIMKSILPSVDTVFHFACSTIPSTSSENTIFDIKDNIENTVKFLQYCVKFNVKRFIFPSSGGTVYGIPEKIPISETHPTNPISEHGVMKLTIEKYIQVFGFQHGLNYYILRIGNTYGIRQKLTKPQGMVEIFLKKIVNNEPLLIWGDGSVVRDFIYIDDLTDILSKMIDSRLSSEIFNIGSGKGLSISEVIKNLEKITGMSACVDYRPSRVFDVPTNVLSIKKIYEKFGWVPKNGFEDGLSKMYQALKTGLWSFEVSSSLKQDYAYDINK